MAKHGFPQAMVEAAAEKIHDATSKAMASQGLQPLEDWEDTAPQWRGITLSLAEISLEALLDDDPLEAYRGLMLARFNTEPEDMQVTLERMNLLRPLMQEWGYLQ